MTDLMGTPTSPPKAGSPEDVRQNFRCFRKPIRALIVSTATLEEDIPSASEGHEHRISHLGFSSCPFSAVRPSNVVNLELPDHNHCPNCHSGSVYVYAVKATPTVLAWADAPSLDDGREESLNDFGLKDQAVRLFRTTSLELQVAVQTRADVLHY
jgi:hypothetical protein